MMLDLKGTQLIKETWTCYGKSVFREFGNLGIWEFTMYVMQYNKSKSGNIMWKQV